MNLSISASNRIIGPILSTLHTLSILYLVPVSQMDTFTDIFTAFNRSIIRISDRVFNTDRCLRASCQYSTYYGVDSKIKRAINSHDYRILSNRQCQHYNKSITHQPSQLMWDTKQVDE